MKKPRVVVIMGVAGSGKSTVGALLASQNGGEFYDADNFHPPANIAKMAAGIPLDDDDRAPWLARLRNEVMDAAPEGDLTVLACSALKKSYREKLGVGANGVALVFLDGSPKLLAARLAARAGHFMKTEMLASQLAALERPGVKESVTVSIGQTVEGIVGEIELALG